MTVKQLKEILSGLNPEDDNLEVFIRQTNYEFSYSLSEVVAKCPIKFSEAVGSRALCTDTVLVIADNVSP